MAIQIIVYSRATGRVRRVIDPGDAPVADVETHANLHPGEAIVVYRKRGKGRKGRGKDTLRAWQAMASKVSGKTPHPLHPQVARAVKWVAPTAAQQPSDVHHIVDGSGQVVGSVHVCFGCGDSAEHFPGHRLVPAAS